MKVAPLEALFGNCCSNPHSLLGLHEGVIRLWRPGAQAVHLEVGGEIVEARRVHELGLFEYQAPEGTGPLDYRIYHPNGTLAHDPYAFLPSFGAMDEHFWGEGTHVRAYEVLGSKEGEVGGVRGTIFAVWAPAAKGVSLIAEFNDWDGRVCPMRLMGASGVWELFVPEVGEGMRYKYEIQSWDDQLRIKSDPFATYSEVRPKNASIVFGVDGYEWGDGEWMEERRQLSLNRPISIYEVHLGSWKGEGNYRQLAQQLADYCLEMGFTHVELLPVTEHPLDESWGYQVSGYYATTSRYGTPEDFQAFVDHLHRRGIGVILDWVPAHFPHDDFSLARFDGTCLYEHIDRRQGFHPDWETAIFNYGRHEVSNFLIANALFWLEKMHIDGLRVDAVSSMLYLDFSREGGEWVPNIYGGRENLEAVAFIKKLNTLVHENFPGALMIAEESHAFPGVTSEGGLGFDMKWNMGWMNDILQYVPHPVEERPAHHHHLTHVIEFAYDDAHVCALSHDEVVHEKRSLLGKMPGEPYANLRLLLSYMWCQPGKKLLFMGGELGQDTEWDCKGVLPWELLKQEEHKRIQQLVKQLNTLYKAHPALWELDFDRAGFEWVASDPSTSLIAHKRLAPSETLVCLHHFGGQTLPDKLIEVGPVEEVVELFDSNRVDFEGSTEVELVPKKGFWTSIAPLSTRIFAVK